MNALGAGHQGVPGAAGGIRAGGHVEAMMSKTLPRDAGEDSEILLGLLNSVEENGARSQRHLAAELGIALGLVNAYLKRCVKKGLLKVGEAPARRYAYYLTPQGFAEKIAPHGRISVGLFFFLSPRERGLRTGICRSARARLDAHRSRRQIGSRRDRHSLRGGKPCRNRCAGRS